MKKLFLVLIAVALTTVTATSVFAAAMNPRPVAVAGSALQNYLNSQGESINVNTDQQGFALWTTTSSNTSTFTLKLENESTLSSNYKFGIYNDGNTGSLFEVFSGASQANWFATATFNSGGVNGRLVVNLFDDNSALQSTTTYNGVNSQNFGFYMKNGTAAAMFSEDDANAGNEAALLVYKGTGQNTGSWWLAWEDALGGDNDYDDMIIFAESINPVPEPGTVMLVGFGLASSALGLRSRRRRS